MLGNLTRGVAGGMLFGIPLLFTMEVWWLGSSSEPAHMALVLLLTMVPVALLVHTAGFRTQQDRTWTDVFMDTIEAVALGVLSAAAVLFLLQEITLDTPFREALGKVVYETAPFSIGVAVARHVLKQGRDEGDNDQGSQRRDGVAGTVADLGAAVVGAVFVAFNISPTDEVPMLAAATSPGLLLAVMAASLVLSYGIVFAAGFGDQHKRQSQLGIFQHPVTETMACYVVALAAAAVMLLFLQNIELGDPPAELVSHVVLLGLPASVGGALGRLAV